MTGNNMKILLLTPIQTKRELLGKFEKGGGAYFPIGLLYIAGIAKDKGHDVELLDASTLLLDEDGLVEHLNGNDYGIIGFGNCYTSMMSNINATAEICKRAQPQARLILGGTHPTIFPKETMERFPIFDLLVYGEGEGTFSEILDHFTTGRPALPDILGIVRREEKEIIQNPPRLNVRDMDDIPFLPYELLEMEHYVPPPSNYRVLPTYALNVSRGCPYHCSYCDVRVHGRKMRYMSVDKAIDHMKHLKDSFGMKGILFLDSIMTVNRKFTIELCKRMIEEKLDLQWACSTRVNCVDSELLDWMKWAGCWNISFGLESGNDESLKAMHKATTVDQAREAVAMAKKTGIQVTGFFILCLPGEDEEMSMNTIRFAKELKMDTSVFFLPVPFPGTELYKVCEEIGGLKENIDWEDYKQWIDPSDPLWVNPLVGKERMVKLFNYSIRTFYLSPGTLWRAARNIKSFTELKKYLKGFHSILEVLKGSFTRKPCQPRTLPTIE